MKQRLLQAFVGIFVFHILSNKRDIHLVNRIFHPVKHVQPARHVGRHCLEVEDLEDLFVQALLSQNQRHFINAGDVRAGDNGIFFNVAEQRDLGFEIC